MKIVTPYQINASDILAHSVTAPPVYNDATTYSQESSIVRQTGYDWELASGAIQVVFWGDTLDAQREFLFIGEDGANHDAPMLPPFRFARDGRLRSFTLNSAEWIEQGTANYMNAFDNAYGINKEYPANTYTYDADGDISWSIRLPGKVTSIAVLGARGTHVRIAKYGGAGYPGGALTYLHNDTLDKLYPDYSVDYYSTLDVGVLREQNVFLFGLAGLQKNDDIFIQVENTGTGGAYVSNIVLGFEHDFGVTLAPVRVRGAIRSNIDFAPDSFTFVPRAPGKSVSLTMKLPGNSEDVSEFYRMQRLLEDYVNTACLYVPDESRPELTVFGLHREPFEMDGRVGGHTYYSMTIEST